MTDRPAGTPSTPPRRQETHDPSGQEVMEVGMAGAQAVNPEKQTPEEAKEAVETAVSNKAQELRITLDPDAISAIADGTIAELERRGAFQEAEREEQKASQEEQSQEGTQTPPEAVAEPPHKRTIAERILGGS